MPLQKRKSASVDDDDEYPECGADTDAGDKFCSDCGAKLAQRRVAKAK